MRKLEAYTAAMLTTLLVVICSLVNVKLFYNQTLSAYYFYCVAITVVIIFFAVKLFGNPANSKSPINIPLVAAWVWLLYIGISGYTDANYNTTYFYLIYSILFYLALVGLFREQLIDFHFLSKGILLLGIIVSGICLLQYAGLVSSKSQYFAVTGTWINPNVTAMFLAMVFPIALGLMISSPGHRKILVAIVLLLLTALLLLKCRTAIIGAACGAIVLLNHYYHLSKKLLDKKNRLLALLLLLVGVSLLIKTGTYLYGIKKDSAEGRKLIYKVSAELIAHHPFTGVGYGNFERAYNLEQARFIKSGTATSKEMEHAGPVNMAYNEVLQNWIEGGLPGAILFLLVGLGFLVFPKREAAFQHQEKASAKAKQLVSLDNFAVPYSAVASFLIMSVFNFTIQAPPVFSLFFVYGAILTLQAPSYSLKTECIGGLMKYSGKVVGSLFIITALLLGVNTLKTAYADYQNRQGFLLSQEGLHQEALTKVKPFRETLAHHGHYWKNISFIYLSLKQYHNALATLKEAERLSADPEIFMSYGYCYMQLKKYAQAREAYKLAVLLHPSKFAFRNALMLAYFKEGDQLNAVGTAKGILTLKEKIPSKKVRYYKKLAAIVLRNHSPQPFNPLLKSKNDYAF